MELLDPDRGRCAADHRPPGFHLDGLCANVAARRRQPALDGPYRHHSGGDLRVSGRCGAGAQRRGRGRQERLGQSVDDGLGLFLGRHSAGRLHPAVGFCRIRSVFRLDAIRRDRLFRPGARRKRDVLPLRVLDLWPPGGLPAVHPGHRRALHPVTSLPGPSDVELLVRCGCLPAADDFRTADRPTPLPGGLYHLRLVSAAGPDHDLAGVHPQRAACVQLDCHAVERPDPGFGQAQRAVQVHHRLDRLPDLRRGDGLSERPDLGGYRLHPQHLLDPGAFPRNVPGIRRAAGDRGALLSLPIFHRADVQPGNGQCPFLAMAGRHFHQGNDDVHSRLCLLPALGL